MTVQMPPPAHVLAAFGAVGVPERPAGGTGRSWLAGSLVLKPLEFGTDSWRRTFGLARKIARCASR